MANFTSVGSSSEAGSDGKFSLEQLKTQLAYSAAAYVAANVDMKQIAKSAWYGLSSAWSALGDAARYADSFFPKIIPGAEAVETSKPYNAIEQAKECLKYIETTYKEAISKRDIETLKKIVKGTGVANVECPDRAGVLESKDNLHREITLSDNGEIRLIATSPDGSIENFILTKIQEGVCSLELETVYLPGVDKQPRKASNFEKDFQRFTTNMENLLGDSIKSDFIRTLRLIERTTPYFKGKEECEKLFPTEDKYSEEKSKPSTEINSTEAEVTFVPRQI